MPKRQIYPWEPYFFLFFGLFHLHRIWALADRKSYAEFWMGLLEEKGLFYFGLMGVLAGLCILGMITFYINRKSNYWWRWIYLFGGIYLLFDLFAITFSLKFWNRLLERMFDTTSPYWDLIWTFFILLGGFSFLLGLKLLKQRKG